MAKNSNSPIKVGSIVRVGTEHTGIVLRMNVWQPGGLHISLPGSGMIQVPLERCYIATEAERKEYFKEVLKYG